MNKQAVGLTFLILAILQEAGVYSKTLIGTKAGLQPHQLDGGGSGSREGGSVTSSSYLEAKSERSTFPTFCPARPSN